MENKERNFKAHVVMLPYPSQGHINPALQFAKRLVSKGLKATLATTIYLTKSMTIQAGPVGVESYSDGCDEAGFSEAGTVGEYLNRLEIIGSRSLAELIDRLAQSGHPVTCLVYDGFFPWALNLAKQLGLVGAAFFTQSSSVCVIYYHFYQGNFTLPLVGTSKAIQLPGVPSIEIEDAPSYITVAGSYPAYFSLVLNQFSNLDKADWVLFNTFDKLEDQAVQWFQGLHRMKTIGPMLPSIYLDKRVEGDNGYSINLFSFDNKPYMEWLDKKPIGSVIYVSLGSMSVLDEENMKELALGLKASNECFLWVVGQNERNKLPSNFMDEIKDKGLLVTWSSQLEVLAHDAVGCFVTHCGWNSTLEALTFGVPMVCIPQWTDQPTNAKLVEGVWGVGVRAKVDQKGIVRREVIENCIREVMGGDRSEELRKNASKWKELAKEAVDQGGSSDRNIQEFVDSLVIG